MCHNCVVKGSGMFLTYFWLNLVKCQYFRPQAGGIAKTIECALHLLN